MGWREVRARAPFCIMEILARNQSNGLPYTRASPSVPVSWQSFKRRAFFTSFSRVPSYFAITFAAPLVISILYVRRPTQK